MNAETTLLHMVWAAGPMVKSVLGILFAASVVSWAIIIHKMRVIRRAEKEGALFQTFFWDARDLSRIAAACGDYKHTPLARLCEAFYAEFSHSRKKEEHGFVHEDDIERLSRVLKKTRASENARLEYAVTFLATAGNTAPFIGLFGTVWGIMNSFMSIGAKGAASLAVVAPGISEALIATALGLFVAIPAVVAYNHFITRIDRISSEMEVFSSDLVGIVEKHFMKRPHMEPQREKAFDA